MRHETRVVMSRIVCACGWSTAFGWSAQEQREGMERAQAHKSESPIRKAVKSWTH